MNPVVASRCSEAVPVVVNHRSTGVNPVVACLMCEFTVHSPMTSDGFVRGYPAARP
jgi:hypothetical protein